MGCADLVESLVLAPKRPPPTQIQLSDSDSVMANSIKPFTQWYTITMSFKRAEIKNSKPEDYFITLIENIFKTLFQYDYISHIILNYGKEVEYVPHKISKAYFPCYS